MQTKITQGPPDNLFVKEGDNAVLTCDIESDPDLELTVEWKMNDGSTERIIDWTVDHNRYKLGSDNSLTVIAVKKVDGGDYTCRAITPFSEDSKSGTVTIQSKFINTALPNEKAVSANTQKSRYSHMHTTWESHVHLPYKVNMQFLQIHIKAVALTYTPHELRMHTTWESHVHLPYEVKMQFLQIHIKA